MGSRRAPWRRLGGLGPLVALLGRSCVVLGASWRSWGLLGRSWRLPGRAWGSFGPPGGLLLELFWASVDGSLARLRKPRKSSTVQHFVRFFEVPGAPESLKTRLEIVPWRVWAPRKTSGGPVGLSWASLALSWGRLRGSWAVPGWLQASRDSPQPAQLESGQVQK